MNGSDDEELELLSALFVAGALPRDEYDAFAVRLLTDRAAAKAVAAYSTVLETLAQQVQPVDPGEALRSKILDQASQTLSAPVRHRFEEIAWEVTPLPGVFKHLLFQDPTGRHITVMLRLDPEACFPPHPHHGTEEILLLEGDLVFDDVVMQAGDYYRFSDGSHHSQQRSPSGCVALIITTKIDA